MPVQIPKEFLQTVRLQAERDYPNETCGILAGPRLRKDEVSAIYPCRNVQDEYHQKDPVSFPRTAKMAYFIDPRELLRIQRELREKDCEFRVIYHSHVDAGSYFSEEDQRVATAEGGPAYPGVSYLVVSVSKGKAQDFSVYSWDETEKKFVKDSA